MKKKNLDFQQRFISENPHKSGFFRVYGDLFYSPAFSSLTNGAKVIYLAMGLESKGKNTFTFPHSAYCKLMSKDGFLRAKRQLIDSGFISEVHYRTVANQYSFSDKWKEL